MSIDEKLERFLSAIAAAAEAFVHELKHGHGHHHHHHRPRLAKVKITWGCPTPIENRR